MANILVHIKSSQLICIQLSVFICRVKSKHFSEKMKWKGFLREGNEEMIATTSYTITTITCFSISFSYEIKWIKIEIYLISTFLEFLSFPHSIQYFKQG